MSLGVNKIKSEETSHRTERLEKLREKARKLRKYFDKASSSAYWDWLHEGFTVEFIVPLNIGYDIEEDDFWLDAFGLPAKFEKIGKALGGQIGSISVRSGRLVFGFVVKATKDEHRAAQEGLYDEK